MCLAANVMYRRRTIARTCTGQTQQRGTRQDTTRAFFARARRLDSGRSS